VSKRKDVLVRLIGAAKLAKGIVLLAVGIGALAMLDHNHAEHVRGWVDHGNEHVRSAFNRLDSHKIKEIGAGSLLYALLFLVEGYGLLRRRVWGEYLTIVITTSFVPLEVYELIQNKSTSKLILLIANIAIVVYLVVRRWQAHREKHGQQLRRAPATA
jgi:uncharacterized membrane protein (DUF2068 family)